MKQIRNQKKKQNNKTNKTVTRATKIRLYMTTKQKEVMRKWESVNRYIYNKAVAYVKDTRPKFDMELKQTLRKKFITATYYNRQCSNCNYIQNSRGQNFTCYNCKEDQFIRDFVTEINPDIQNWEKEVPKDIRDRTLDDFYDGINSSLSLLTNGIIKQFEMRFRIKNCYKHKSMEIDKNNIHVTKENNYQFFKNIKELENINTNGLAIKPDSDARIVKKGPHYFLHFETLVNINTETHQDATYRKIIALDPGVRKFITGFSETEVVAFHRDEKLIKKLYDKIDNLKSLRDKKWIRNPRRSIWRKETRIRNIVTDLHYKTANYLCTKYTDILIPVFETQQMIKFLPQSVSRLMGTLSHFTFRQRLIETAEKHQNCLVYVVNESFTTVTCTNTNCGYINPKCSDEILTCKQCNITMDRDIRGSRNNFVKHVEIK